MEDVLVRSIQLVSDVGSVLDGIVIESLELKQRLEVVWSIVRLPISMVDDIATSMQLTFSPYVPPRTVMLL